MARPKRQRRADGWQNLLTGFNVSSRDKRLHSEFNRYMLNFEQLFELYRGNDIAARICSAVPDEMIRRGFEVVVNNDVDTTVALNQALEALHLTPRLHEAAIWANVTGGAALLLGTDDEWSREGGLVTPLNLNTVNSLEVLTVLDARELVPLFYYDQPFDPKYGQVRTYRAQPLFGVQSPQASEQLAALFEIHESRIIRFEGIKVARRYVQQNLGWGDSRLQRPYAVLRDYNTSWDAASTLLHDYAQGVFKMAGLSDAIAADQSNLIMSRIAAMDMARSTLRSIVIDSEGEEFTRQSTPLAGLGDLLDKFATRLAAAADMPVTVLMGQSPAGLSATGASDIRLWYDRVASAQQTVLVPAIRRVVEVLCRSTKGPTKGAMPAQWAVQFAPLYELDDQEEAQRRLTVAQADQIYIQNKVFTAEEIAHSRAGGPRYSAAYQLDLEARAKAASMAAPKDPEPAAEGEPEDTDLVATGSATDPRSDANFNPEQPRGEDGRWNKDGGPSAPSSAPLQGGILLASATPGQGQVVPATWQGGGGGMLLASTGHGHVMHKHSSRPEPPYSQSPDGNVPASLRHAGIGKYARRLHNKATKAYVSKHSSDEDLGDVPGQTDNFDERQSGLSNEDMANVLKRADTPAVRQIFGKYRPDTIDFIPFEHHETDLDGNNPVTIRGETRFNKSGARYHHYGIWIAAEDDRSGQPLEDVTRYPAAKDYASHAPNRNEMMARALLHEAGHVLYRNNPSAHAAVDRMIQEARAAPQSTDFRDTPHPLTERGNGRGEKAPEEYFAECFAIYQREPCLLAQRDPFGYRLVDTALKAAHMPADGCPSARN